MRVLQPNGRKIAELRESKGWKQISFAKEAGISERLLRYVENENKPIRQPKLLNVASSLGVALEEITMRMDGSAETPVNGAGTPVTDLVLWPGFRQLELRPVNGGRALWEQARPAEAWGWSLEIEPTRKVVPLIEELLTLVKRGVFRTDCPDEWDAHEFSNLYRMARLNELLAKLEKFSISVLSNTYVYRRRDEEGRIVSETRLRLALVKSGMTSLINLFDAGLRDEDFLDDEIPF